jgi:hypothetical protein
MNGTPQDALEARLEAPRNGMCNVQTYIYCIHINIFCLKVLKSRNKSRLNRLLAVGCYVDMSQDFMRNRRKSR